MATDDERREVAQRLRECRGGWSSGECYYTIIHALGLPDTSREDGSHALYAALADLIDPDKSIFYDAEWRRWYEGLYHSNGGDLPKSLREELEEIVWEALTVDLGPNGNVFQGIDEGLSYTEMLFGVWECEIRDLIDPEPELTCHVEKYPPNSELYFETCSVCGCILSAKWPGDRRSRTANYCPNCGNRVVG